MAKTIRKLPIGEFKSPKHQQMYYKHRNKPKKIELVSGKLATGPGGICCPCCTKFKPSVLKKKTNRFERRKLKQQIWALVEQL